MTALQWLAATALLTALLYFRLTSSVRIAAVGLTGSDGGPDP